MSTVRGGRTANDVRLDRVPLFDEKSKDYKVRTAPRAVPLMHKPRSYTWSLDTYLDQGQEGACVSAGWGHDLAARPAPVRSVTMDWCRQFIYWPAQRIDPFAGGAYPGASPFMEGTAVLSGAKVVQMMGLITEYRWCFSLEEFIIALGYFGPVVLGLNWYRGMADTDANGFIHPTGILDGGHCVAADKVDIKRGFIEGPNSWGRTWGNNGRWRMTIEEFDKLRKEDGEACVAMGRKVLNITKLRVPVELPSAV